MQDNDPHINPRSADVFNHDTHMPYANRTVLAIVFAAIALVGIGALVSWYFWGGADQRVEGNRDIMVAEKGQSEPEKTPMPGNLYKKDTGRSSVYDFFYQMFGGIDDGLEDSPHNLENVERIDDLNIDNDAQDVFVSDSVGAKSKREILEEKFDGKIVDYRGQVAGKISAIRYDDGEVREFHFILAEALTPEDEARRYSIPEDEVKVVEDGDIFFIQLNREQTEGLANSLYDGPNE